MVKWWKTFFGAAEDPAQNADAAVDGDPWTLVIEAACDLSNGDQKIEALLTLARDDPEEVEDALDQAPYGGGDWYIDYAPGDDPGVLFRDVMMVKRFLAYLDWKDGSEEIIEHYDAQMTRLGLDVLTTDQRADIELQKPTVPNSDRLFFPDFVHALDRDAQSKARRVLVFDEGADSYAFFIVHPKQFERWHAARLGLTHRFFSPDAFVTDQTQ